MSSGRPYITDVGNELVVVSVGPNGVHASVKDQKSIDEIRKLLSERQAIGKKITDALKRSGMHTASDEATEAVDVSG